VNPSRVLDLTEFVPNGLDRAELSDADASILLDRYAKYLDVEFPTPKTGGRWRLTANGFVGYLPVSPALGIRINPKVPIRNLFRMLETAYGFKFDILSGQTPVETLDEYLTELASLFGKRVIQRSRRGFYRAYLQREEALASVRGRIDFADTVAKPWRVALPCTFEEHSADVDDNQIVAWGLRCALASGRILSKGLAPVREAYRIMRSVVDVRPVRGVECVGRTYNRLNEDYELLHGLSRLFIDRTGPTNRPGSYGTAPFIIDMAGLFEAFVANWLTARLPMGYQVTAQHPIRIGGGSVILVVDLVIWDASGQPAWVLDTKYKSAANGPSPADLHQVVSYAEALRGSQAGLVYPATPGKSVEAPWGAGDIRIRTLSFRLGGNLDAAGEDFLQALAFNQASRSLEAAP